MNNVDQRDQESALAWAIANLIRFVPTADQPVESLHLHNLKLMEEDARRGSRGAR